MDVIPMWLMAGSLVTVVLIVGLAIADLAHDILTEPLDK